MLTEVEIKQLIDSAEDAARQSAQLIADEQGRTLHVINASRRDVKLLGDMLLEKRIVRALRDIKGFPILSEESGLMEGETDLNEYQWVVDPLDGSLNHSRGIPISCISIALWKEAKPVGGVVYDFIHDEMFSGVVGLGAWLNDTPIRVGDVGKKRDAVLCTGFPTGTDFSVAALGEFVRNIQSYKKVRLLGSAALSLVYVASGRTDAYMENDIAIWDVAAGIAIVEAAGGTVQTAPSVKPNRMHVRAASGCDIVDTIL